MNLNGLRKMGIKNLSVRIQLLNQILRLQKQPTVASPMKRVSVVERIPDLYTPNVSPYLKLQDLSPLTSENEPRMPDEEYVVNDINLDVPYSLRRSHCYCLRRSE